MSKAKIASKNNPEGRSQAKEYFYNEKRIKPAKLITGRQSFFVAEYDDSSEVVTDQNGKVLPWRSAKNLG